MSNRTIRAPYGAPDRVFRPSDLTATPVTPAGVTLSMGMTAPGVVCVLGKVIGYEMAGELVGSPNWAPIQQGTAFAALEQFALRTSGITSGDPVFGYWRVCDPTDPACWDATVAAAKAFAGYPSPDTNTIAPGGSATTLPVTIKNASLPGPTYDSQLIGVSGPNIPLYIQIDLDTNTPGGTNTPDVLVCLASSAALAQAGSGPKLTAGGDFNWPGGPLYVCEIAIIAAGNCLLSVTY